MESNECKSGIYCIRNKFNNMIYIGSSINIENRIREHRNKLNKNKHENPKLQNAWNKYGGDNFEFIILSYETESKLRYNEQLYIHLFGSLDRNQGYNISEGTSTCVLKGENNPRSSLTNKQVVEIKILLYQNTLSQPDIAKQYNVSISTIENIKHNKSWKHIKVPNCTNEELRDIKCKGNKKLDDDAVYKIKQMLVDGYTQLNIAKTFDVGETTIGYIKSGKTYSHLVLSNHTNEEIANMQNRHTLSDASKNKISKANKGRYLGNKSACYGKHLTEEVKNKISKANTGKNRSLDFKEKQSQHNKGEGNIKAKLNESQVVEIRSILKQGLYKIQEIADMFNVSMGAIKHIKQNRTWQHII